MGICSGRRTGACVLSVRMEGCGFTFIIDASAYVHAYACIYVSAYVYVHAFAKICTCNHDNTFTHTFWRWHVRLDVYSHAHVCCKHLCIYNTCISSGIYTMSMPVHLHVWEHLHIFACICMQHMCMRECT